VTTLSHNMIKQLHPTLKACKCGFIGSRKMLYKHFDSTLDIWPKETKGFFNVHGEVVLNVDDPRLAEPDEETEQEYFARIKRMLE
jgi:hypothetical protein